MTDRPRPGWYADPTDDTQQRWYSGSVWTDQTRPAATADTTTSTAAVTGGGDRRWSLGTKLALVAGALALVTGSALVTMWVTGQSEPALGDTAAGALDDATASAGDGGAPDDVTASAGDGGEPGLEPADELSDDPVTTPDDPTTTPDSSTTTPDGSTTAAEDKVTEAQDPADTEQPVDRFEDRALTEADLVAVVASYVDALDAGDIRAAHALLAPSLQQKPGWSLTAFVDFWDGYLEGAVIVEFDAIVPAAGQLDAVVRYLLTDDGLSEEEITFRLARASSGRVLIEDYIVQRAQRIR